MHIISLEEFYKQAAPFMPANINKEIGHFNVFNLGDLLKEKVVVMPYNRRAYYKISLINGKNKAEYADKVVNIEKNALLFATPKIPYNWQSLDEQQSGFFCIFTDAFLTKDNSGTVIDELPVFRPGGHPVFQLQEEQVAEVNDVFRRMFKEIAADYKYKYDLLRNYLLELIHYGQKLQPASALYTNNNATTRVSSLFIELLERQFPIESPRQTLNLRTAKDYADRLFVHVNYLNRVLKEATGKTTTEIIIGRIIQEGKILLKQTNWSISEIAYSLGFEELAHFSNFFKKQTTLSPAAFRE